MKTMNPFNIAILIDIRIIHIFIHAMGHKMKVSNSLILLKTCLFMLASAVTFNSVAAVKNITDVMGREVKVDLPAKRVVLGFYFEDYMAVGTEKAFDSVVGISRDAWESWVPANWDMHVAHRPSLKTIPDVGEVEEQTFSLEKVLSLKPDLVILAEWQYKALGSEVKRLEDEGIPVVVVDYNAQTVAAHTASTRILGDLTGQEERANELANFYANAMKDVNDRVVKANIAKPKVYVEFGNKGPAEYSFTYGKNMGAMIAAAGGDNIATPFVEWWGPLNPEQVLASRPDAIFISGRENNKIASALPMGQGVAPEEARKKLAAFETRQGWNALPAISNNQLFGVYQGASRTLSDFAMVQYIAKALYPQQFSDVDPVSNYLNYYKKYLPVTPQGTFAISVK